MPYAYSAAIQDEVALKLSGRSFSALTTDQKKMIDGNATPPTVTSGAVKRAEDVISEWAEYLTYDPSAGIPTEWTGWVVALAALKAASRFSTADQSALRREEAMARADALTTYNDTDLDSTADTDPYLVSAVEFRRFVVSNCMALERRPLLPTPRQIDTAIVEILHETWDMADWSFRRQGVTLTIGTDSSVTVDPDVTIDRLATSKIVYVGSSTNTSGGSAQEVDALTMQRLLARSLQDGRPQYFRLTDTDSGVSWVFDRTPDQEYTAKAEVIKQIGDLTTPTELGTAAALFPTKFQPYLRKKILATVLENASRYVEAGQLERECDELAENLHQFDSPRAESEAAADAPQYFGMGDLPTGNMIGGWT